MNGLFLANIVLVIALFAFIIDQYFSIRTVLIIGSQSWPVGLDDVRYKNILFINEHNLSNYLLAKDIGLHSLSIRRQLPDTLIIALDYRKPVAQFIQGDYVYYIDSAGLVFQSSTINRDIPIIEALVDHLAVGDRIDSDFIPSLQILPQLADSGIPVKSVRISSKDEILYNTPNYRIMASTRVDYSVLAASLQTLIKGFRIEGKSPRILDMRFAKPVVHF